MRPGCDFVGRLGGKNGAKMRQRIPMGSKSSSNRDNRCSTLGEVFRAAALQEFSGGTPLNSPSLMTGLLRSAIASQATITISGTDKAIVLNAAAHAIRAVSTQGFDPYHANSTKNRPHAISAVRMMHGDAQSAFPDLTRHKGGVRQTVEPVTAQIAGHGLHDFGQTGPNKADRPVDLHPGSSSTLPHNQIRSINRMCVQAGRKTVDQFRQHKKVPAAESIFRAINKPKQTWTNPHHANYLPEFSMFLTGLQITPKNSKTLQKFHAY